MLLIHHLYCVNYSGSDCGIHIWTLATLFTYPFTGNRNAGYETLSDWVEFDWSVGATPLTSSVVVVKDKRVVQ
jgi:hypothetical protein